MNSHVRIECIFYVEEQYANDMRLQLIARCLIDFIHFKVEEQHADDTRMAGWFVAGLAVR